ncbi:hypothetical protein [Spiribacter roseus]|uniref:hypothetical protein n=1 Tax=Spiribacter roseus TaxID=1855875 RepID=UPI00132F64A4|nr:hypothetical protein [Spiribacter roseus]
MSIARVSFDWPGGDQAQIFLYEGADTEGKKYRENKVEVVLATSKPDAPRFVELKNPAPKPPSGYNFYAREIFK